MSEKLNKAKDVLLRALEQLDKAEEALGGEPDRVDLVVVYAIGREVENNAWRDIGGWVNTPGPSWAHEKLLEEASFEINGRWKSYDSDDEPPSG